MLEVEKEKTIYQWVGIVTFCLFLVTGLKYNELRVEYHKSEKQKVKYCLENRDLCQKNALLTKVNSHYSIVIDKMCDNDK